MGALQKWKTALVDRNHKALKYPSVLHNESNLKDVAGTVEINPNEVRDIRLKAKLLVRQFVGKYKDPSLNLEGGWKVSIEDFARSLETLIDTEASAYSIYQGDHNLCGPAVFCFLILKREPLAFVNFALDLFEKREAALGDLSVKAGSDLVATHFDTNWVIGKKHIADWLIMSSLRDSSNVLLDYEGTPSENASGITTPADIESWMNKSGLYKAVLNDTNLIANKDVTHALQYTPSETTDVCWLLDGRVIGANIKKEAANHPNHWIVVQDIQKVGDSAIEVTYFSWGEQVLKKELSIDKFNSHYYGLVKGQSIAK